MGKIRHPHSEVYSGKRRDDCSATDIRLDTWMVGGKYGSMGVGSHMIHGLNFLCDAFSIKNIR